MSCNRPMLSSSSARSPLVGADSTCDGCGNADTAPCSRSEAGDFEPPGARLHQPGRLTDRTTPNTSAPEVGPLEIVAAQERLRAARQDDLAGRQHVSAVGDGE